MVVQYQNGYPNRSTIKKLLEKCDVDIKRFNFVQITQKSVPEYFGKHIQLMIN